MSQIERRSYVRGNFSFKIKFKTMTSDEYKMLVGPNKGIPPYFQKESFGDIDNLKENDETSIDPSLIKYLALIDEKLDLILELLAKDPEVGDPLNQGMGMNISGSGMNIMVDKPVEIGHIIHSKFYLSKVPLVFIELFGEIVRSTKADDGVNRLYSLGVKFLDISVNDRERIISSVFQRQRKILRKMKSES